MLGLIWKHLCKFWGPCENPLTGVDSHKWESKVEIFKSLSGERFNSLGKRQVP